MSFRPRLRDRRLAHAGAPRQCGGGLTTACPIASEINRHQGPRSGGPPPPSPGPVRGRQGWRPSVQQQMHTRARQSERPKVDPKETVSPARSPCHENSAPAISPTAPQRACRERPVNFHLDPRCTWPSQRHRQPRRPMELSGHNTPTGPIRPSQAPSSRHNTSPTSASPGCSQPASPPAWQPRTSTTS